MMINKYSATYKDYRQMFLTISIDFCSYVYKSFTTRTLLMHKARTLIFIIPVTILCQVIKNSSNYCKQND